MRKLEEKTLRLLWLTRQLLREKKGQNTVEYLMMLAVVAVVIMAVGGLMKQFMPELFNNIKEKILGAAGGL
ncbi:MAG: hypothetical protein A3G41_04585 [Elusimicrobia bacterium RIFCSPLOWO2_12_FULL_59_9]|nr:hypothetical protein [Elusimicrobiota bacterium]OGS04522.1 MAG: hypothetical protein A3G41_04585 [Elusimicrobia bacterium RIFCSPLOWO2_12_FULL_59_9]